MPGKKVVSFENGNEYNYDGLVSSVPLKSLIPMIVNVPKEVLEASEKLACSTCVLVNIGIDRRDISDAIWTYFYDEDMDAYSHSRRWDSSTAFAYGCGCDYGGDRVSLKVEESLRREERERKREREKERENESERISMLVP